MNLVALALLLFVLVKETHIPFHGPLGSLRKTPRSNHMTQEPATGHEIKLWEQLKAQPAGGAL